MAELDVFEYGQNVLILDHDVDQIDWVLVLVTFCGVLLAVCIISVAIIKRLKEI